MTRGSCRVGVPVVPSSVLKVSHIMATAAQNGSCIVWDLKQKKPWCELRDSNRAPVTDVAWNPQQGQHLVTGEDSPRDAPFHPVGLLPFAR